MADWRWRIANPTELSAPVDKEDAAIIILTETCGEVAETWGEMTEICGKVAETPPLPRP